MPSAFEVIAEPSRRAILSLLATSSQSVGELGDRLHLPQPTVSKHLKVLRDAGFVEAQVNAQRRVYRIRTEPFREVERLPTMLARFLMRRDLFTRIAVGPGRETA